ncbi:MAG: PAS domain S-box protein [Desulfobacteraceae bacterium]|nr:PAS domain S-box protein [Desulfobacteraceae bacterium]
MSEKPTYKELENRIKVLEKEVLASKNLKDEVQEGREKYQNILDNILEGYYEVDLQGNFVFFNGAMEQIMGFKKEKLMGMNNREFMEVETAKKIFATFNKVYSTGKASKAFNWTVVRKDGEKRYIEGSISLMRDSRNSPKGFRGIVRDITKIKASEIALLESEKKYRTLVENTPDLLYRTNMDGVIIYISPSLRNLTGYSVEEVIGMDMAQEIYLVPEERKVFLKQLMETGVVQNFEAQLKRKDGTIWWASTNAHFYTDENGKTSGVEGVTRDITNQKQVETALRESEEKFRLAFMTSPDSVSINRLSDGKYIDVNNGYFQIIGYSREEVLNKTSTEMDIWLNKKKRASFVAELKKNGSINNLEGRFKRKDGSIRYGLISASLIKIDQEAVVLTIIRDVTEQKRTQEVLIQSEKMLSMGGLAAGMAHEINNPLAGMIQNAQVIANRMSSDLLANQKIARKLGISMQTIEQYMVEREIFPLLSSLRTAGKRAADIVTDILSFSRKDDVFSAEVNIEELLNKTIEIARNDYDLKKKYDFRKVHIIREYEKTDVKAECNGSNIQQVILNILRNAAEALFEEKENKEPEILIRMAAPKGHVRIEIIDNGPGMDEKIQKYVFDPFFTTKPVGVGTGLGLSVSYFIITEIHNGRIFVESSPGNGSKFIVELPMCQERNRGSLSGF